MPDQVIAGGAAPANANLYPPGTLWMQVTRLASDATGKTVLVQVWCTVLPDFIAYNLAGPGYDMQGGPFLQTVKPAAWTAAPAAGQPGRVDQQWVLPNVGFYHFETHADANSEGLDCQAGTPDATQMGPSYDPELIRDNTVQGRVRKDIERAQQMARATPVIGAGTPMKKVRR